MPTQISSLPNFDLDYTKKGPGLIAGMKALYKALEGSRAGYVRLSVKAAGSTVVQVVMQRSDLYLLGIESGGTWYRFKDASWGDLAPAATDLGYKGGYDALGGLAGTIDAGTIAGIAKLASGKPRDWKTPLRTLLVVVSECTRLTPVQMRVLGVLNGVLPRFDLKDVEAYIHNWDAASKGKDMSKAVNERLKVGFPDPTILKNG